MRIVIDTNVTVSAVIKRTSVPYAVFQLACQHHTLLKSRETEQELRLILQRDKLSKFITPSTVDWLDMVLSGAETVHINHTFAASRDATDDKFLDLAVNGPADLIITGDADLLVLGSFRDIPVIAPITFLRAYYPGRLA